MVFLELGLLKCCGASSSSLLATSLLPTGDHDGTMLQELLPAAHASLASFLPATAMDLQALGSQVSGLVTGVSSAVSVKLSAVTAAAHGTGSSSSLALAARESIVPAAVALGAHCVFKKLGVFADLEPQEGEEEEDGVWRGAPFINKAAHWLAVHDTFMVATVMQSIPQTLTIPLRTWVVGGLVLSFPATWMIDRIAKRESLRWAFALDVAQLAASFAWLSYGTVMLGGSPEAVHAAPLLWWSSFSQCILAWSMMTTGISVMVLMTVVTLFLTHAK